MIGNGESSTGRILPADSYQMESMQQPVQTKHDDYYTVSPGENYYTEYGGDGSSGGGVVIDDNQTVYSAGGNYDNSHEPITPAAVMTEAHNLQYQQQADYQQYPQQAAKTEPIVSAHIPNYLQSDTDDSQTGYRNDATNKTPQNHDSDFDFSTNSDAN